MKKILSFNDFLNENFRIDSKNEKLISKMVINGAQGRWELNAIDLNDDGDEYIVITGQYAKSITDSDTI